jgi:Flp pilus assembly protein TadG
MKIKPIRRQLRFPADERGAAVVEFAIVVSLLLIIVFGIIAFGRVYSELTVMESAAREGAREAAVRGTADDITSATTDAAAPFTLDATPTADRVCDDSSVGERVTVSWVQNFEVELVMAPTINFNRTMKGVFRCE